MTYEDDHRREKAEDRERNNASRIELLDQKVEHLAESLIDQLKSIQKSIDKLDLRFEKMETKSELVLITKIPGIEQQLTELKVKASLWGGLFGAIASFLIGLVLRLIPGVH